MLAEGRVDIFGKPVKEMLMIPEGIRRAQEKKWLVISLPQPEVKQEPKQKKQRVKKQRPIPNPGAVRCFWWR